jgi:hypothetical protein
MAFFNEGQGPMFLGSDLECNGYGLTECGFVSFQPGSVSLTGLNGSLYANGVKLSTAGDTEVLSTNGSGIVVNTSGDIVTLSSGLVAGPGINLAPSATTKIITISAPTPSLSQVLTAGSIGNSMTLQSLNVANNSLGTITSDNLITSPNYRFTTLQLSQPTPTRISTNTNQTLAYLSDIPVVPGTPNLQQVCATGNVVGGAGGIVYAPSLGGTPQQGVLVNGEANYELRLSNNDQTGNVITLNVGGGVSADGAGTVQCSTIALPTGANNQYMNVSKVSGQNRLQVAQTGQTTEEIAYLSDIVSPPTTSIPTLYRILFSGAPFNIQDQATAPFPIIQPTTQLQTLLTTTGMGGMLVIDMTAFQYKTSGPPFSNGAFTFTWQTGAGLLDSFRVPIPQSQTEDVYVNLGMVHLPLSGSPYVGPGPWTLYLTNTLGVNMVLQSENYSGGVAQCYATWYPTYFQ